MNDILYFLIGSVLLIWGVNSFSFLVRSVIYMLAFGFFALLALGLILFGYFGGAIVSLVFSALSWYSSFVFFMKSEE